MKKFNAFFVLFNVPFMLYLLSVIILVMVIKPYVIIPHFLIFSSLLLVVGILLSLNKRKADIVGFVTIFISIILGYVIGKEEYLKWSSLYLTAGIGMYYLMIYVIKMIYLKLKK